MNQPVNVIITVNSPGEVSGWLRPFVNALKQESINTVITVFIPPCTFASGSEAKVVRAMPGVEYVIEPNQVWNFILTGKLPPGFQYHQSGVVLFLGGDLCWAAWIAKRLAYPAVAYTEGFANMINSFAYFAQPYPQMINRLANRGVPHKKLRYVGNLMLDAVQPAFSKQEVRDFLNIGDRPVLLLMPGSRPSHFEYMFPFLLEALENVKRNLPDVEAIFNISSFIDDYKLQQVLKMSSTSQNGKVSDFFPGRDDSSGVTSFDKPGLIKVESGLTYKVFRGRQYEIMTAADLAISLPGTNTMELSFMGVPTLVTLPLNHPERIPLEGIPGLIGNIPFLGKVLKRWLVPKLAAKTKFTAWPNLLAEDEIVPELRGNITAPRLSQLVIELLQDKERLYDISKRQKDIVGEKGAAARLVLLIQEVLNR